MAGRKILVIVLGLILFFGNAANANETSAAASAEASSTLPEMKSAIEAVADTGDELSRLLQEESATRTQYASMVKKMNKFKYAAIGLGGVLGVSLLTSLVHSIHAARGAEGASKLSKLVDVGTAGVGVLSLIGGVASYMFKRKAEQRAKEQAKELLSQRQAMLAELQEGDQREGEVTEKADEIANITENLGLFDSEIDAAMRAAKA